MRYRVWDTDLGRLFGAFDTEEEALALVRTLASSYGPDIEDLTLSYERDDGSFGEPEFGAELVARAEEVAAERERALPQSGEVVAPRRGPTGFSRSGPLPMAAKDGYSCDGRGPRRVMNTAARKPSK